MNTEQADRRLAGPGRAVTQLVALLALLSMTPAVRAQQGESKVGQTRTVVEQWVKLRDQISKTKRDQALAEEMLRRQIEMVRQGTAKLREQTEEAKTKITEATEKRDQLQAEKKKLQQAQAELAEAIVELETRVKQLLQRVPKHNARDLEALVQGIPKDPEKTDVKLTQRYQKVVSLLAALNKAQGEVTVLNERRELPGGKAAEVTAMYLGLGQAYYVGANGTIAGRGTAGPNGWTWTAANTIAEKVALAVAIYRNEEAAAFVQLPVVIQNEEAKQK
jgi:myosin heavy subunit